MIKVISFNFEQLGDLIFFRIVALGINFQSLYAEFIFFCFKYRKIISMGFVKLYTKGYGIFSSSHNLVCSITKIQFA